MRNRFCFLCFSIFHMATLLPNCEAVCHQVWKGYCMTTQTKYETLKPLLAFRTRKLFIIFHILPLHLFSNTINLIDSTSVIFYEYFWKGRVAISGNCCLRMSLSLFLLLLLVLWLRYYFYSRFQCKILLHGYYKQKAQHSCFILSFAVQCMRQLMGHNFLFLVSYRNHLAWAPTDSDICLTRWYDFLFV